MPIPNITQPETISVRDHLRLRRFDGHFDFALEWYQDTELVWLVDGNRTPYSMERLRRMYNWLDAHGELYFIEAMENGIWKPIGDVTFWQEDMPIVIGDAQYRGKGIGKAVVAALIDRGRELGYRVLCVGEIYDWNHASRRCFESLGFRKNGTTEKGNCYQLQIDS